MSARGFRLAALLLWSACARFPPAHSLPQESAVQPQSMVRLLAELDRSISALERDLRREDEPLRKIDALNRIREITQQLKAVAPEMKNRELWEQYCDAISGILIDVEIQLRRSYWPATRNSFARVRKLQKQMLPEAGLGFFERLQVWFKTIF